jgi:tryptophanyl-tRNA synthetase
MILSSVHTVRNETGDLSVGHLISKLQNAAHQQKASHNFKAVATTRRS